MASDQQTLQMLSVGLTMGGQGPHPIQKKRYASVLIVHTSAGVALAKVAANCVPDSDSSQHVQHSQHADGVAECPWSELQAVAIETVKLMLATMNETYSENNASDVKESLCGEMNQTAMKNTRGKKKQQPEKAASTSASAEDCDGLQVCY